ncbi:vesicle-associated membrane protein 5 [Crotalus tigris]|uniref:vesicle-associated membrane protein 5 n=1 Tax=Crotalus tigris TaxID=88082 RepID=UPI00192F9BC3|nr:vesicle-associated membrane protein 5 [Crotalus tigris]
MAAAGECEHGKPPAITITALRSAQTLAHLPAGLSLQPPVLHGLYCSPKRFSGLIRTGGAPTSGAGSEDGRGKSHRRPSPPLSPLEPSGTRRHGGPVAEESRSRRSEVRRAESNGRRVSARSAAPAAQAGRASGGAASARSSSRQARRPAPRGLRRGGELSGSSGSRLLFPLGRPEDAPRLLPEDPARVEAPPGPLPPPQLPAPAMGENHLGRCQQEAEEVTEIMLDNYTKVLDREGKLSDLDERADELCKQSSAFTKTTKTLAQKKRWENMRFKIILLAVVVVAVLLIVITLYFTLSGSGNQVAPAKTSTGGD